MKKNLMNSLLLTGTLVTTSHGATLIAEDLFNYSPGVLSAQSGTGSGFSSDWINGTNAEFSSASLDYLDPLYIPETGGSATLPDSGGNARQGRLLTTTYDSTFTGTLYLSFLFQTTPNGNDAGYRALELHDGGFNDGAHRTFQVGFQNGDFGSNAAGATDVYGFRLSQTSNSFQLGPNDGGVNLFVVKFDLASGVASDSITVWQNPSLAAAAAGSLADPAGGVTITGQDITFDRITIANFGNDNDSNVDEIRLSDTFGIIAIPEPSTSLLMGLAGIGLLSRRRK